MSGTADSPGDLGIDLDALPEWARKVLSSEKPRNPGASPEVTELAGSSSWPTLVSAAMVSSFLPDQLLKVSDLDEAHRLDAEKDVLIFAEEVHGQDGTKWSLTPDARRSVLSTASREDIQSAVMHTQYEFTDLVSVALREQLSTSSVSVETALLPTLEATRVAATWLRGVAKVPVDLDDLGREITLRRLLKPFRRMVGILDEGPQVDPAKIRFFGRDDEIEKLRNYVGVVPASSLLSRLAARFSRVLARARPLFICGLGGVGKTTLIAKFVLEHAEAARSRYPFAYLDFDRATLSARRPELLLAEMCAEVGAQFPELTEPMRVLQDMARALSVSQETSAENAAAGSSTALAELGRYLPEGSRDIAMLLQLMPLLAEFRAAVDTHISNLESFFEWKRPFLLMFDTFELVQYSDADVRRIEDFVRVLTKSRDGLGWSRLRLIVSGRKKPEMFLEKTPEKDEVINLGVLDRPGCVEMLQALASDAGQPIDAGDAQELVDAMIAGLQTTKPEGLHPLSLKLLGTVLASTRDSAGNSIVGPLIKELKGQPTEDTPLRKALIDGILIRRILEHVSDKRVRALADPGLVVRRITPPVIREVMARGTPSPDSSEEIIAGDSLDFRPWQLPVAKNGEQDAAEEIFDAFKHEVSLVETDDIGLRHRQDLRQEMLPLIKDRRPNRFRQLHKLAFDYFHGQALLSNLDDRSSCAEAIYHGLWLGAPIESVDRVWPQSPGFDPRLDPEEFKLIPLARRYIRAKTRQPLSSADIAGLPQSIAIEWLISKRDTFLDDDFPNDVTRAARSAAGDDYSGLDKHVATAAIVTRLLYRTGQWADSQHLIARHLVDHGYLNAIMKSGTYFAGATPSEQADDDRLSMLRTWTTMSAKLGADPVPLEAARTVGELGGGSLDPIVRTELLSFAAMGNRMLKERSTWSDELRSRVAHLAADAARQLGSSDLWLRNGRALRYAILASEGDVADLLIEYLHLGGVPPLEEDAISFTARLLSNTYAESGNRNVATDIEARLVRDPSSPETADFLQSLWSKNGRMLTAATLYDLPSQQALLKKILAFDHYDWIRPLGNALSRAFEGERGPALRDALVSQKFLADLGNRPSTLDGLSICQWANAGGRLLRLASTIDDFAEKFSSEAADESESYPETAFGIAEALLLWHDVNLGAIEDIEDTPAEVPVPKKKKSPPASKKRAIKTSRKKK